ncbi:MAG: hypothetical protein ACI9D5_000716 [Candidatus Endobugula sp.]
MAIWQPTFAGIVSLKPDVAPLAAKNIFPRPRLYANGSKKIINAMVNSSNLVLAYKHNTYY